jgi:hypothetical protein
MKKPNQLSKSEKSREAVELFYTVPWLTLSLLIFQ